MNKYGSMASPRGNAGSARQLLFAATHAGRHSRLVLTPRAEALEPKSFLSALLRLSLALALASGNFAASAQEAAEAPPGKSPSVSVFDMPRILEGERAAAALAQMGDLAGAGANLRALMAKYPALATLHYELAALLLRQNRKEEALAALARAVELGLPRAALENVPAFAGLYGDQAFQALLAKARPQTPKPAPPNSSVKPFLVETNTALVSVSNTGFDPRLGMLRSLFRFADKAQRDEQIGQSDRPGKNQHDAWFTKGAALLNSWLLEGTAAGNYGDLYDNRDGGHSTLPPQIFPQLARVQYSEEARNAGLERGLNRYFLFNAVTIGNASLAVTAGPMWRSLPREALTDPTQVASLFWQYVSNHIYVYPAHQDYGSPRGDLITANTPYMLISVGSSGSDQPLLKAVAAILAAFRPEVKTFLIKKGLISPTVQWIFRRGQLGIDSDEDYLSGRAHPSAFKSDRLNLPDMVERAHNLAAEDVPPMVQLRVKEESHGKAGIDLMSPGDDEKLFDTPSAIARIFRSTAAVKRLVVEASQTADPNGRALTFRWSVLRGDKGRITLRPLNDQGSAVEIIVPWDAGAQPIGQPNITGDRVEIGVFANNGKYWSAPAFISLLFPGNEKRTYSPDGKIAEVDYDDPHFQGRYVDPALFPVRGWRDSYRYDQAGHLLGWTRFRGETASNFTRDGAKTIATDQRGRPVKAEQVRYELMRRPDGRFEILEKPTGAFVTYSYSDDHDLLGIAIPMHAD